MSEKQQHFGTTANTNKSSVSCEDLSKCYYDTWGEHLEDIVLFRFGDRVRDIFIGKHPAMLKMYETIKVYSARDMPILIKGESGAGKQCVAKLIHKFSARKDKVFYKINSAELIETLAGSQLFGHEKGAFTG